MIGTSVAWVVALNLLCGGAPESSASAPVAGTIEQTLRIDDPVSGVLTIRTRWTPSGPGPLRLTDAGAAFFSQGDRAPALFEGARPALLELAVRDADGRPLVHEPLEDGLLIPSPGAGAVEVVRRLRVVDRSGGGAHHPFASSLGPEGGVFLGLDLFLVPEAEPATAVSLRMELPDGWTAVTPWSDGARGWRPRDAQDLGENFFAVGVDLRVHEVTVGRNRFTVCGPGSLEAAGLRGIGPRLAAAVEAAVKALGPLVERRFLVLLQYRRGAGHQRMLAHRGANARRSVVAWVDPRHPPAFAEHPLAVVVHELTHWWNAREMSFVEGGNNPWFSEGATTYLELLLLLRAGEVDLDFLVQGMVDHWQADRAVRAAPISLEEASAAFTRDGRSTQTVYRRGALVAFGLDLELRERGSGSLEQVLRRLIQRARVEGELRPVAILESVREVGGDEVLARLRDRLASRETPQVGPWIAKLGYEVQVLQGPYLGVRLAPAERVVVEVVQPRGPASGRLLERDVLRAMDGVAFEGPAGFDSLLRARRPGEELVFTVERGGEELEVTVVLGSRPEPRAVPLSEVGETARRLRRSISGG